MPRTTSKIHRYHLSLFEDEFDELKKIATEQETSISKLTRLIIRKFISSYPQLKEKLNDFQKEQERRNKVNPLRDLTF